MQEEIRCEYDDEYGHLCNRRATECPRCGTALCPWCKELHDAQDCPPPGSSRWVHPELPRFYVCGGIRQLAAVLDQNTNTRVGEYASWAEAETAALTLNQWLGPMGQIVQQVQRMD